MPFSAPLFTSHAPDDSATPRRSYSVCALRSWTPERLVQRSAEAGRSIYDTLRFRVGQTRSLLHILAKVSSLIEKTSITQDPGQDSQDGLHTQRQRGYNPQNRNRGRCGRWGAWGGWEGLGVDCGALARREGGAGLLYLRRGATGPAGVGTGRLWQAPCLARCVSVRTGRPLAGKGERREVLGGQGLSLWIDLRVSRGKAWGGAAR